MYYLAEFILQWAQAHGHADGLSWMRIFEYVSVRAAGAAVTAFVLSIIFGKPIIAYLKKVATEHYVSLENMGADGKPMDTKKMETPSMGGILIVSVMDISALLWGVWNNLLMMTIFCMIVLGLLGFFDDWRKVSTPKGEGVSELVKTSTQIILGGALAFFLLVNDDLSFLVKEVMFLFNKDPILSLGTLSTVIGCLTVVGVIFVSSNSVNLTDGVDGLAIGCTFICSLVFLVVTYVTGRVDFSAYLNLSYVRGACELTVFSAALCGACLGFLWFNCNPAHVFMGDTGALAIGGAMGIMSVLVHQPLLFFIAGGLFIMELSSSAIQRYVFKFTRIFCGGGRRVFLRAPLHGHFRKKGWSEAQISIRFYIIAIMFAVAALASLKIR